MQQQREGCARASKLQGLQEVRDPLCPTVVQWEIAVAEWLRGSNFRERVGNEYVTRANAVFYYGRRVGIGDPKELSKNNYSRRTVRIGIEVELGFGISATWLVLRRRSRLENDVTVQIES